MGVHFVRRGEGAGNVWASFAVLLLASQNDLSLSRGWYVWKKWEGFKEKGTVIRFTQGKDDN